MGLHDKIELQQAGTLGINKRIATAISKMPFEKSETGKFFMQIQKIGLQIHSKAD